MGGTIPGLKETEGQLVEAFIAHHGFIVACGRSMTRCLMHSSPRWTYSLELGTKQTMLKLFLPDILSQHREQRVRTHGETLSRYLSIFSLNELYNHEGGVRVLLSLTLGISRFA